MDDPSSPRPPTPPPDFNPPAHISTEIIESALSAIASPPHSHDGTPMSDTPPLNPRPPLQLGASFDSSRSGSDSSDGQTHLSEMREHLMGREGSGDDLMVRLQEASPTMDEDPAWDSVWPSPETVHRAANTSLAEANRFPIIAPVSPFVTPTFSPALLGRSPSGRRPLSPKSPSSPNSPRLRHQRSASSSSPVLRTPSSPRRPRGHSVSRLAPEDYVDPGPSVQRRSPERRPSNDDVPPLSDHLPPPVASVKPVSKDDAAIASPLARPVVLRRALSDFDAKARGAPYVQDKSPKRSTSTAQLPSPVPPESGEDEDITRPKKSPRRSPNPLPGSVELVDEGDVLPQETDLYMDVTFEDEGLTTLERIFLLSKSEFPFHRNYIARVLGDLLYDVDPCESVEYILPLVSAFPADDDEGVREAFASELHRILWYFYTTCRVDGDDDRPALPADFFTPLLGSLLLNANTAVTESVRNGVVAILARLKGGEVTQERWGIVRQLEGVQTYPSQTGDHLHSHGRISDAERDLIETELLTGIVIGMGSLSTELPEEIYMEGDEEQEMFQAQLVAEATAGQATSMNLIGALCEFYPGEEALAKGFVDEVLRCADGEEPGRAEGAIALAALAKIVPADTVPVLVPLFEHLARDESVQVRQSLCVALPPLCRRVGPDRRAFAVAAIDALAPVPDVRNSLLDVLGELIYAFSEDPDGPPVEVMRVYMTEELERLGEDWDTVAAFNFPAVALTLGPARWGEIRGLYRRLNERASAKPRRSLAASLHELGKILRPEQCAEDLLPVFCASIDDTDEIRELVFERLDVFLQELPLETAWKTYLDLARRWKENSLGGWRAREQLALHIPAYYRIFRSVMKCEVLDMMQDALLDPFAAVRDAATKGIPDAYETLQDEGDISRRFREALLDLGRSDRFRRRLTFTRCLREFVKPPPNRSAFEEFFLPFLPTLARDVVDVRLGLAQSVADLFVVGAYYAKEVHAPQQMYALARQLAQDEAVDVRDTVRNVDLDHLDSHDSVPYEVKSPEVVKRGVTPSDLEVDDRPAAPRTQSSDMMTHLTRMVLLTPTNELSVSPFFSASPNHPPRTPLRPPSTPGSYMSSPSPSDPGHGLDPFSSAFGHATPEMVAVSSPSSVSSRGLDE